MKFFYPSGFFDPLFSRKSDLKTRNKLMNASGMAQGTRYYLQLIIFSLFEDHRVLRFRIREAA